MAGEANGNGNGTPHLTPTERRMYELLSDGRPHSFKELFGCLDDELSGPCNLRVHVSRLRAKLKLGGEAVCSVSMGRTYWYVIIREPSWFGPVP